MICYLILHYQNFEVTCNCVDRVLQKSGPDSRVLIVDNASPNGSGIWLMQHYADENKVIILRNSENEGFSRGNNRGYEYIRNHFKPECVVVMNNDVLIEQDSFEDMLLKYAKEMPFAVIGPDIVNIKGCHQNPMLQGTYSSRRLLKQFLIDCWRICLYSAQSGGKSLPAVNDVRCRNRPRTLPGCVLHGACLILFSQFIRNEKFVFPPKTFLYGEELLFCDYLKYRGYRWAYVEELSVLHLCGASTGMTPASNLVRKLILYNKARVQIIKARITKKYN